MGGGRGGGAPPGRRRRPRPVRALPPGPARRGGGGRGGPGQPVTGLGPPCAAGSWCGAPPGPGRPLSPRVGWAGNRELLGGNLPGRGHPNATGSGTVRVGLPPGLSNRGRWLDRRRSGAFQEPNEICVIQSRGRRFQVPPWSPTVTVPGHARPRTRAAGATPRSKT